MDFPTRIDWWLLTLVGGGLTICLGSGIFLLAMGGDVVLAVSAIVSAALVLGLMVPMRYRIEEDGTIRIRAGFFLWRIPLAAVQTIRKTNNPLFAPAWSLRRLHIDYQKPNGKMSFVLISPKERELFLKSCSELDSGLALRSGELARAAAGETSSGGST